MASVVALDASPVNVLRSLRGSIVDARVAYPDVLHVEVRDAGGDLWRLATQDAEWTPPDPGQLVGRSIDDVAVDGETGECIACSQTARCLTSSPLRSQRTTIRPIGS